MNDPIALFGPDGKHVFSCILVQFFLRTLPKVFEGIPLRAQNASAQQRPPGLGVKVLDDVKAPQPGFLRTGLVNAGYVLSSVNRVYHEGGQHVVAMAYVPSDLQVQKPVIGSAAQEALRQLAVTSWLFMNGYHNPGNLLALDFRGRQQFKPKRLLRVRGKALVLEETDEFLPEDAENEARKTAVSSVLNDFLA
jgi:hypothetical protein